MLTDKADKFKQIFMLNLLNKQNYIRDVYKNGFEGAFWENENVKRQFKL